MNTKETIFWACDRNEISVQIEVVYSNRLTKSAGVAQYLKNGKYRVKLSSKLFARATPQQQRETIVHETCHCIEHVLTGKMSHGKQWKKCMVKCGYYPRRCHDINTDGLTKQWVYACECREHKLSTRLHNSIKRGRKRHCKGCKGNLVFVGEK